MSSCPVDPHNDLVVHPLLADEHEQRQIRQVVVQLRDDHSRVGVLVGDIALVAECLDLPLDLTAVLEDECECHRSLLLTSTIPKNRTSVLLTNRDGSVLLVDVEVAHAGRQIRLGSVPVVHEEIPVVLPVDRTLELPVAVAGPGVDQDVPLLRLDPLGDQGLVLDDVEYAVRGFHDDLTDAEVIGLDADQPGLLVALLGVDCLVDVEYVGALSGQTEVESLEHRSLLSQDMEGPRSPQGPPWIWLSEDGFVLGEEIVPAKNLDGGRALPDDPVTQAEQRIFVPAVPADPLLDRLLVLLGNEDRLENTRTRPDHPDLELRCLHQNGTSSSSSSSAYMASSSSSTMVKKPLSRYAEQNSTPARVRPW
nr:MAG TPA: hypothetical protein [Caudoviricetes sp.]